MLVRDYFTGEELINISKRVLNKDKPSITDDFDLDDCSQEMICRILNVNIPVIKSKEEATSYITNRVRWILDHIIQKSYTRSKFKKTPLFGHSTKGDEYNIPVESYTGYKDFNEDYHEALWKTYRALEKVKDDSIQNKRDFIFFTEKLNGKTNRAAGLAAGYPDSKGTTAAMTRIRQEVHYNLQLVCLNKGGTDLKYQWNPSCKLEITNKKQHEKSVLKKALATIAKGTESLKKCIDQDNFKGGILILNNIYEYLVDTECEDILVDDNYVKEYETVLRAFLEAEDQLIASGHVAVDHLNKKRPFVFI